ncbi:MAG TPA: ABC transporter permease [Luteitalea sp.]|nr:ABC transporter permease [Luteitalea sp.]
MGWMRRFLNSGSRQSTIEQELTDEVAFHRAQQAADLEAEGWTSDEARREARRRVGLQGTWVAAGLAEDTLPWVATWLRETRQALRSLTGRPWFMVTTAGILAVGIGLLLAALALTDAWLVRPWPIADAGQVVVLEESVGGESIGGNPARSADWRRSLSTTDVVAGLYGEQLVLGRGATATRVQALRGVGPLTQVLGLKASDGRGFTPSEEAEGAAVVLLTHQGWQRHFGGSSDVVGRVITLRGESYQVVGILPRGVDYPTGTDLVAPAGPGYQRAPRGGNWLQVVARLRPTASPQQVQSEADGVARRFAEAYPDREGGLRVRVTPLQDFETRELRTPLLLLLGAAATLYLVVCVNVGGLLLVRALARDHESAVRRALGAGRWAMARLTAHEALLLAVAAAPVAWLVASTALDAIATYGGGTLSQFGASPLDARALVIGIALLAVTTAALAVWPAYHVATRTMAPRSASHAVTDAPRRRQVRRLLVAAQVACSTTLVILAMLFARSANALLAAPRGFDAANVVALRYDLDWEQEKASVDALARRVLDAVSGTPGVTAAGIVDRFPMTGGTQSARVTLFGETPGKSARPEVSVRSATPGYFEAMAIPFLHGEPYRDFAEAVDRSQVVVNATFARRFFGATDAIGRRLSIDWESDDQPPQWLEVVGVVGDVRQGVRDEAPVPEIFRPWARAFWPLLHVAVRGDGSAAQVVRLRERLVQAIPDQPIASLAPLDDVLMTQTREPRLIAQVLMASAFTAAVLAMIGLYGLLASEMMARRREVGIRLALGARPWELRGLLLRPGVLLTLAGVVLGVAGSLPAARVVETQLFGVSSGDVMVRVLAGGALLAGGLVAALVPAWRVVGRRALAVLRYE